HRASAGRNCACRDGLARIAGPDDRLADRGDIAGCRAGASGHRGDCDQTSCPRHAVSTLLAAAAGALAGAGAAGPVLDALRRAHPFRGAAASLPAAARRLAAAERPGDFGTREWTWLKCCTAALTGLCGLAGAGSFPGRLPFVAVI